MKAVGLLRNTVVACALAAAAAAFLGVATGHAGVGFGLSAGLLLGSLNGYLIQGLMARGTPFAASGVIRILAFSSLTVLAAFTLHAIAWTIPLGIGLAQLVLVGAGLRQGLRA